MEKRNLLYKERKLSLSLSWIVKYFIILYTLVKLCDFLEGTNSDRDTLSRDSKERSSRRSVKSVKEKDTGKENIENKETIEKREKKILHRLEKIEKTEKVKRNHSL